jgi:hypothetical protein
MHTLLANDEVIVGKKGALCQQEYGAHYGGSTPDFALGDLDVPSEPSEQTSSRFMEKDSVLGLIHSAVHHSLSEDTVEDTLHTIRTSLVHVCVSNMLIPTIAPRR